jgi:cytochrome P450
VGIHRCPGSHLARIEFAETIEAVLTRMPDFAIDLDDVVEYPGWSMIGGWERIPATFTPGARTREVS